MVPAWTDPFRQDRGGDFREEGGQQGAAGGRGVSGSGGQDEQRLGEVSITPQQQEAPPSSDRKSVV